MSPSYSPAVASPVHHHPCAEALRHEIETSRTGLEARQEGTDHLRWADHLGIVHDRRPEDIEDEEEEAVDAVAEATLDIDLDVQYLGRGHDHRGVAGQSRHIRVLFRGAHPGAEEVAIGGAIRRPVEAVAAVEAGGGVRAIALTATAVGAGAGAEVRADSGKGICTSICIGTQNGVCKGMAQLKWVDGNLTS